MSSPTLLARLSEIKTEAERALEGLENGAIPKGTSALTSIKHTAADALHDAHKNGQPNKEEAAA